MNFFARVQNPYKESPLQKLEDELLNEKQVQLFVKRDDLIHEHIQGNKWRKLKYNLLEARLNNFTTLLTFGGAYSNHIYATAAAAKLFHFKAIGIIRGNEPEVKSETLHFAAAQGMDLYYMDRETYRQKENLENIENLRYQFGNFYYIPEGGTNSFALEGVAEIVSEIEIPFDFICTSCGTGGTLAGLGAALNGEKKIIGFSSLKGEDQLTARVNQLTKEFCGKQFSNFEINFDYHFGGYAKVNDELITFIKQFKSNFNIQLEPVYTGKMFFGLFDLIRKNYFPRGSTVVALHTGGLQGLSGYAEYFQF